MKVKIVIEVKRSDGLWRFACGDVSALQHDESWVINWFSPTTIINENDLTDTLWLKRPASQFKLTNSIWAEFLEVERHKNKLANYDRPSHLLTGVKCWATSIAKNLKVFNFFPRLVGPLVMEGSHYQTPWSLGLILSFQRFMGLVRSSNPKNMNQILRRKNMNALVQWNWAKGSIWYIARLTALGFSGPLYSFGHTKGKWFTLVSVDANGSEAV